MAHKFFLIFVVFYSVSLQAQIKQEIPVSYERNSLTVIFVDYPAGNNWSRARTKVEGISFSDKYDNNNLSDMFLSPSFSRGSIAVTDVSDAYLKDLNRKNSGRDVISKWYNRKSDGTMDMELVHQRGRFSATDADFLVASSTQRGDAALEDLGNRLVNKSFILLFDVDKIQTMAEAENPELKGWRADISAHLYRIDFNENARNAFYDTWIYEDDSPAEKQRKKEAFNKFDVALVKVTSVTTSITSSQTKKYGTKTEDQLLQDLLQKAYDDVLYNLEMQVNEFRVTTVLFGRRPLRAKVGLKEGLRTDHRFFVYEHVLNAQTNTIREVRRGVIRAGSQSKIHDNRHEALGNMGTSQFYQVSGRRLHEGYTIVQKNDTGAELTLGAESGEIGGAYGRLDVRSGRFTGIRALFIYVEGGVDGGAYPDASESGEGFTFLRVGGGIAKGLQLTRNSELRPYLGAGVESASNGEEFTEDTSLQSYYFRAGANLALNLTHNFQLLAGAGNYSFISNAENKDETGPDIPWKELFENRSGLSYTFGIKFMF
jgi:hypothetical protein